MSIFIVFKIAGISFRCFLFAKGSSPPWALSDGCRLNLRNLRDQLLLPLLD